MSISLSTFARRSATVVAALLTVGGIAGAQVQATFYSDVPASPNPLGAFPSTMEICSNTAVGTPSGGFSLNFGDPIVREALCPSDPDAISAADTFSARFAGSLFVAATGQYDVFFNTDDGDALAVDGVIVDNEWGLKGGGPGTISLHLNAGENPFVLDYFNGACCGAYAMLEPRSLVSVNPPVSATPEPGSVVLMATGFVGVAGVAMKRRRRSA